MAQTKYVNYEEALTSWVQNIGFLGPVQPGRYAGFDTLDITGTLTFQLTHAASGISVMDPTSTIRGPWGMYVTQQGVYVQENANIQNTTGSPTDFTIVANSGTYTRYDFIYAHDTYVAGTTVPSTYGLILGSGSQPNPGFNTGGIVIPALVDPNHDVFLGYLSVPPGATAVSQCTWYPLLSPFNNSTFSVGGFFLGPVGDNTAKLNGANVFYGLQQHARATGPGLPLTTGEGGSGNYWLIPNTGNQIDVSPTTSQVMDGLRLDGLANIVGTKIRLHLGKQNLVIRNAFPITSGIPYEAGNSPLSIPSKFWNYFDGTYHCYNTQNAPGMIGISGNINTLVELELVQNKATGVIEWLVTNITDNHTAYESWQTTGLTYGTPSGYTISDMGSPYYPISYKIVGDEVHLSGCILITASGGSSGTLTILTLPTQVAPSNKVNINPLTDISGATGFWSISTSGVLTVPASGGISSGHVFLDDISYRLR